MMRREGRARAWWVLPTLGLAAASACQDDGSSSPKCGAGTRIAGDTCVAVTAGGNAGSGASVAGKGGSAGKSGGGSSNGGTPSLGSGGTGKAGAPPVGDAGDGGEATNAGEGGTGGSASGNGGKGAGGKGGAGNAGGGLGGDGAGGANGGAGAGGAGAGAGGTSGSGSTQRTSHWLLYRHMGAVYAYDVETFPAAQGTLLATAASLPDHPWSPDGSKVLYNSAGNLYVRDMSTRTPGAPVTLAAATSYVAWSGDSGTLALNNLNGAVLIDVGQAAPIQRPVPGDGFTFAPIGNQLAFVDSSGLHVTRVTAGVPGQSTHLLDGVTGVAWSHDATLLAAWIDDGLSIVNLRGGTPVVTEATPHAATGEAGAPGSYRSVENLLFSADDSRVTFNGYQEGSGVWTVDALAPDGPVRVNLPLTGNQFISLYRASSDGTWVNYMTSGQLHFVSDLTGSAPVTTALPAGLSPHAWVPGDSRLIARDGSGQYVLIDAEQPNATPIVVVESGSTSPSMGGPGSAIAYGWNIDGLKLDDLAGPSTPPTTVTFANEVGSNLSWRWSRNAEFIAVTSVNTAYIPDQYFFHLFRVDGTNASSAIQVQGNGTSIITTWWQP